MPDARYLVTARKYRPQTFAELVSQEHVSGTLKNAIQLDRLAHAYLFSGPRGVGKTTAARILAKAINCTAPLAERTDGEPCRQCDSCRSFEAGRNLNIIEIDAASNNSVDDIRDLREKVLVPPQGARKKVYIIDEVHMLSNAAFNALLKTLEEPPPHVLFIFATTEPHKVLPTILSRCQRFDFRRIAVQQIMERLRDICGQEAITADDRALMLIARKGDGALRDALSVFDQAVSLCGTTLTYEALADALGVVSIDLFFDVTRFVHTRGRSDVLRLVDHLVQRGYDFQEFLGGLTEHLRNLLVARTMQSTDLIEADHRTRERYAEAATSFAEADLLRLLMMVDEAENAVKNSPQPRLKLELALLKMTHLETSADLAALILKLDALEQRAERGPLPASEPPAAEAARTVPAASRPETPPPPAPKPAAAATETPPEARKPEVKKPEATKPEATKPEARQPEVKKAEVKKAEVKKPDPEPHEPAVRPAAHNPAPSPAAPSSTQHAALTLFGTPALKRPPAASDGASNTGDTRALFAGSSALSAVPKPMVNVHFGLSLQKIVHVWPAFTLNVSRDRIHVGAMLQHAEPTAVDRGVLQVSVPDEFHRRLLSNQKPYLQERLAEALNGEDVPALTFLIDQNLTDEKTLDAHPTLDPFEHLKTLRQENPIIRAIFDRFGGEPVW